MFVVSAFYTPFPATLEEAGVFMTVGANSSIGPFTALAKFGEVVFALRRNLHQPKLRVWVIEVKMETEVERRLLVKSLQVVPSPKLRQDFDFWVGRSGLGREGRGFQWLNFPLI
jgi:hypothetical protein